MAVNIAFSNETTIAIITFAVAIVIASVMALARRNEEFTVSLLSHRVNELFNRVRVLEFESYWYRQDAIRNLRVIGIDMIVFLLMSRNPQVGRPICWHSRRRLAFSHDDDTAWWYNMRPHEFFTGWAPRVITGCQHLMSWHSYYNRRTVLAGLIQNH